MCIHRDINAEVPSLQYGLGQEIMVTAFLSITCAITVVSLVLQQRWKRVCRKGIDIRECKQATSSSVIGNSVDSDDADLDSPVPVLTQNEEESANPSPQPLRVTAARRARRVRGRPPRNSDTPCDTCTDCGDCSTSGMSKLWVHDSDEKKLYFMSEICNYTWKYYNIYFYMDFIYGSPSAQHCLLNTIIESVLSKFWYSREVKYCYATFVIDYMSSRTPHIYTTFLVILFSLNAAPASGPSVVTSIEDLVPDVMIRPGRRRIDSQSSNDPLLSLSNGTTCALQRACSVTQRSR